MAEEPNHRTAQETAATGRIPAQGGATPCQGDAETLLLAAEEVAGLESRDDDPSREHLFRRGQTAIELLEAIRVTNPERLADLSGPAPDNFGDELPPAIGRFRILRELGRGGYGVVLLAHDPHLNRRVALKIPRPEALVTADLRRRFLREAEAAAALNHPHIVPIYEQGTVGPICYVASAFCDAQSLASWLTQRQVPVPPLQAANIIQALADAVQHAHSRGVLHRDLKPANVLLLVDQDRESHKSGRASGMPDESLAFESDGDATDHAESHAKLTPLIIDFGLARIEGAVGLTMSNAIVGTPAYMAPEQAAGKNDEVGMAADIYALGTILYQLLTLQLPFPGKSDLEMLQAIQLQEPKALRRWDADIPRDLEAICLKCLEKLPQQRYASAAGLYADLDRFLAGRPVKARPIGSLERLRRWVRRNPALAAMSVLAFALFAVGAVSVCWQWRRAESSLVEVQQQKDRATSNLHAAQNAVDELLTGIAAEMRDLPQTEAIRMRLLKRAAVINQRFLQDESVDQAEASLDSIKAWRRAADIFLQLGDLAQTEKSLGRVIELCESLSKREPSAEVVEDHVNALCMLSGVTDAHNDWKRSQRILQGGLVMLDAQPANFSAEVALWRAEILRSLGINAERQNELDEAGEYYHQSVEHLGQREVTSGDTVRQLVSQAKIHSSYAIHCKQRHRFDQAMQHFGQAQSALEILRERRPDDAEYQAMTAMNQYNMANLDLAAERYDLARSRYLKAKNDFKQLAASFPRIVKYRELWCHSLFGATLASKQRDQIDNRILMLKKAAFLREEILREHPELLENTAQLKKTYRNLGRDHMLAQQYDDARRCFRRSIECTADAQFSAAAQQPDRMDDAWACSLMGRLEMKCQRWPKRGNGTNGLSPCGKPTRWTPWRKPTKFMIRRHSGWPWRELVKSKRAGRLSTSYRHRLRTSQIQTSSRPKPCWILPKAWRIDRRNMNPLCSDRTTCSWRLLLGSDPLGSLDARTPRTLH